MVNATALPAYGYPGLIRLSEVLGTCRDRSSLLRALPHAIGSVLGAEDVIVTIGDGAPHLPPELERDEALADAIIHGRRPIVIRRTHESRFPALAATLSARGAASACVLPLATSQRLVGCLIAYSAEPYTYDDADRDFLSLVGRQVALAIEHADSLEALQNAVALQCERTKRLETSDELLRALSDVLDIRDVFPQVSQIASRVLPHDGLTLTFHDGEGGVVIEATSRPDGPRGARLRCANPSRMLGDSFAILDDLETQTFDVTEPADFWERIRAYGFRSMLAVGLKAREQQLGLLFWSKRPGAFHTDDLPVARRIADHVALAVSHEQLAQAASRVAEAYARAERLEARTKALTAELDSRTGYGRIIGRSAEWQAVLKAATQVAATDTTVLLTGESGTGKEVVARYIHRASGRSSGPFVALNCAALPEQLLESELFGYERGAFTGAQQPKAGQLELAAGGVLFLDEVSEMSLAAQAKFLRALQEREFQRLGATRVTRADVRVIAATNRDLKKAVERKDFREDLYYRLRVFDIVIPPLRARPGDILPLSEAFLHEIGRMFGRPPAGLTRDAKQRLMEHRWPGNVRELRNALERAAILCDGGLITAEHLSLENAPRQALTGEIPEATDVSTMERELIARALRDCAGNRSKAARQLGLSRTQLYGRLRKYDLA